VLTDHVRIRHLAGRLNNSDETQLELLHELGTRVERHVRVEERELFPLIERAVPEPELRRPVTALSH
jgi:hypothetical protein